MKHRTYALNGVAILSAAIVAGTVGTGCLGALGSLLGAILGINVLGVTPANNFGQTGNVELSLLPTSEDNRVVLSGLNESGLQVGLQNPDGTTQDCTYVNEHPVVASRFNSLAVVLDSSGSMERSYPQDQYGDLCPTCPHDPDRLRIQAAADLINTIRQDSPDSHLGVMDFGPDPDPGMTATRILADFGSDTNTLLSALDRVAGDEMAGTPMFDSLAEIILALDQDADQYEGALRSAGQLTDFNPTPAPTGGVDPTGRPVAGSGGSSPTAVPTTSNPPLDSSAVRRIIVVITDGQDLDSTTYDLDSVIQLAQDHNVTIHAIGLGPASSQFDDPRAQAQEVADAVTDLQRLAQGTGGFYASVSDPQGLEALYRNIAASLTQGYATTTYSCRPDGGAGTGQAFTSGQRVNGFVSLANGVSVPWSVISP